MEKSFGPEDVCGFLKTLIETGDVFYVDSEYLVRQIDGDEPQGVKVGNSTKKIALFSDKAKTDSTIVYLNPFGEYVGQYPEKDWFYNIMSIIPGSIALYTMKRITEIATDKKNDSDFKVAKTFAKFVDRIDDKFMSELQKVRPTDVGVIFYDRDKQTAQVICDIFEKEWEDKMKSRIRKSSLKLIQDILASIFQTDDPAEIMYTATTVGCPKFDAIIHTLVDALERMAPITEKVTSLKLHVKELKDHLEHIEAYHKALQWMSSSSASPVNEKTETASVKNLGEMPWKVKSELPVGEDEDKRSFLERVAPAGVAINPNYRNGTVFNPTFGAGSFGEPTLTGGATASLAGGLRSDIGPVLPRPKINFGSMGGMGFGGFGC